MPFARLSVAVPTFPQAGSGNAAVRSRRSFVCLIICLFRFFFFFFVVVVVVVVVVACFVALKRHVTDQQRRVRASAEIAHQATAATTSTTTDNAANDDSCAAKSIVDDDDDDEQQQRVVPRGAVRRADRHDVGDVFVVIIVGDDVINCGACRTVQSVPVAVVVAHACDDNECDYINTRRCQFLAVRHDAIHDDDDCEIGCTIVARLISVL
jgi:hypothetical protein